MNKLNLNQLKGIIIAGLVLVIGILLCCSLAMGINGLSIVAGIILIIFGILFISNAILIGKKSFIFYKKCKNTPKTCNFRCV